MVQLGEMTDKLTDLQKLERAARGRYGQNAGHNDLIEAAADAKRIREELAEDVPAAIRRPSEVENGLRLGYLLCDCICNCGSIVQVVRMPRKGTNDTLCMACLERSNRMDPEHKPWPVSGVVVLPPEKK